jgi:hypothetical protein
MEERRRRKRRRRRRNRRRRRRRRRPMDLSGLGGWRKTAVASNVGKIKAGKKELEPVEGGIALLAVATQIEAAEAVAAAEAAV